MHSFLSRAWRRIQRSTAAETSSSDASESEDDVEAGVKILHKSLARRVILEPDETVVKIGAHISPSEAVALKVAYEAGLPAPPLHDVASSDGKVRIRMGYIQGQVLESLWPTMSPDEKKKIAEQVGDIIKQMRELEPPQNCVGCCDGTGIRDTRIRFTYDGPVCTNEEEFNDYLNSTLFPQIPSRLRAAFRAQLRTDHRIVLTHGDLTPRNILIQNGKISGIVDWEESGWYPEYWELAKFFERPAAGDWKEFADILFPELYHNELVTYTAMSKWRKP